MARNDVADELTHALALPLGEAAGGDGSRPHADAARDEGRALLAGDGVLVDRDAHRVEQALGILARDVARRGEVNEQEVVVGPAGDEPQPARLHAAPERLCVGKDGVGVGGKVRGERLAKGDGLAGDDVLERAALAAGEDRGVEPLGKVRIVCQDEAAARSAQGLVRGGGGDVRKGHGAGVAAGGHEAGDVGHVHHEGGAHGMGDLGEALEVDDARVGRGTGDDHLGAVLLGERRHGVVVNALRLGVHAVGDDVVELAGEVGRRAVREVAAVVERHAHDGVAGRGQRREGGVVGLGARVRLHVGKARAEELAGTVAREVLRLVDRPAAAIVALAGQALGVLVGEGRPHGLHDGRRNEVLRRDELDGGALAAQLVLDRGEDLGIGRSQVLAEHGTSSGWEPPRAPSRVPRGPARRSAGHPCGVRMV